MPLIQRSFHLLNARSNFAIFFVPERSALMALVFYNKGKLEGNDEKNPAILGFFQIERAQLNAAHAQLLKKLRPIAFGQSCRFLTIQSLEFQEIWQKNSSSTA